MLETDFLIIGAGIAGAGIAYRLAEHAGVTVIEMESQPGYHTTGRSAAFYAETYGGPAVQPLTTASKHFFRRPPEGFADTPLLTKLGAVHVIREGQQAEADRLLEELSRTLPEVERLSKEDVLRQLPYLKGETIVGGIFDPECAGIDVAAIHHGFLKGAKKQGAKLLTDTALTEAVFEGGYWHIGTSEGLIRAKVLINASGAWADEVAKKSGVEPLGLQPLRRTIVTIDNPAELPHDKDVPLAMEVGAEHYFKPEGAGYLLTPGDEVLTAPCDVQPENEDVALAVHQFECATGSKVAKLDAKWAGLRTFADDRAPVIGYAPDMPHFFWSVGQGGFGIQTAPAWSLLAASLALGKDVPEELMLHGVQAEVYSPARFCNVMNNLR